MDRVIDNDMKLLLQFLDDIVAIKAVPGHTAFQLWPLGTSLNSPLSFSLLSLLRCTEDVMGPNLRSLCQ